jgi:hypothetical protein
LIWVLHCLVLTNLIQVGLLRNWALYIIEMQKNDLNQKFLLYCTCLVGELLKVNNSESRNEENKTCSDDGLICMAWHVWQEWRESYSFSSATCNKRSVAQGGCACACELP